jgi:hypothetical protein
MLERLVSPEKLGKLGMQANLETQETLGLEPISLVICGVV